MTFKSWTFVPNGSVEGGIIVCYSNHTYYFRANFIIPVTDEWSDFVVGALHNWTGQVLQDVLQMMSIGAPAQTVNVTIGADGAVHIITHGATIHQDWFYGIGVFVGI